MIVLLIPALALWALIALAALRPGRILEAAAHWAPVGFFVVCWLVFLDYHIDDAGISYAYAQNLASGLGLRPFASSPPVEGYSNPSWTMLLAVPSLVGVNPELTSKALQLLLGPVAILLAGRLVQRHLGRTAGAAAAAMVATHASFAVWCNAGLENALFAVSLVAGLDAADRQRPLLLGGLAALAGLTRPEGALFSVALLAIHLQRGGWRPVRGLLLPGLVAAVPLGGYLLFRWLYFGDLLPNTYYAKMLVRGASRWHHLLAGLRYTAGGLAQWNVVVLVLGLLPGVALRRSRRLSLAGLLLLLCGAYFAIWSGGDWMRQWRFVSHLVPLLAVAVVPGLWALAGLLERLQRPALQRLAPALPLLVLAPASLAQIPEVEYARLRPTLPLAEVRLLGEAFLLAGPQLCGGEPVAASPDIGGVLQRSPRIQLLDLVALVDREAARQRHDWSYWIRRLQQQPRPQLVFTHGVWSMRWGLHPPVMRALGYRPLCRRPSDENLAEQRFPPIIYARADCEGKLDARGRAALMAACAAEAR